MTSSPPYRTGIFKSRDPGFPASMNEPEKGAFETLQTQESPGKPGSALRGAAIPGLARLGRPGGGRENFFAQPGAHPAEEGAGDARRGLGVDRAGGALVHAGAAAPGVRPGRRAGQEPAAQVRRRRDPVPVQGRRPRRGLPGAGLRPLRAVRPGAGRAGVRQGRVLLRLGRYHKSGSPPSRRP